jgi:predicted nucleotidyltransferase
MAATDTELSIPAEAAEALAAARYCLGASLAAAYLHGSAVVGGLRPDSDVDILLVTDRPLSDQERRRFLADLMRISGRPKDPDGRRPLEVTIFGTADLAPLGYPPRSEFHYGEWLRAGFEGGALAQPQSNPDFVIVIAQTRQAALTLAGPPPDRILPEIPAQTVRRAIGEARAGLLADLRGDERNVLLTLARMWCTLETGRIVPKDVAAEWAAARIGGPSAALLDQVRRAYLGQVADDWRKMGAEAAALARDLSDRVAARA